MGFLAATQLFVSELTPKINLVELWAEHTALLNAATSCRSTAQAIGDNGFQRTVVLLPCCV